MADQQLTSVKVNSKLFDDFKIMCVRTKLSLQKLTDRAMYLYVTDSEFKQQINNTVSTYYTGSQS
jgi:predicted transcriptional regulator